MQRFHAGRKTINKLSSFLNTVLYAHDRLTRKELTKKIQSKTLLVTLTLIVGQLSVTIVHFLIKA